MVSESQESPMPSTTLWEPLEVQRDVTVDQRTKYDQYDGMME